MQRGSLDCKLHMVTILKFQLTNFFKTPYYINMKKTVVLTLAAVIILAACNTDSNTSGQNAEKVDGTAAVPEQTAQEPKAATPASGVVTAYLQVKNALTSDDAKGAATAATSLSEAVGAIDAAALPAGQKEGYAGLKNSLKEHADAIAKNGTSLASQRTHFEMLSTDVYDLVKALKTNQTLYKEFCPMYNDGKGGTWISETKEIRNPYYGKEMLECGEVQEEIR